MKRYNQASLNKTKAINSILKLFIHEQRYSELLDIKKLKEILIIEVSLIGDEIMTIPFYKTIKANNPNAKITVVGRKWISNQLIEKGVIDEIIEFDGFKCLSSPSDWLRYRKEIKETLKIINGKTYDLALEPRGDIRFALFMHFTNAIRKSSFDIMNNAYMLTDPVEADESIIHEVPHRLSLLERIGYDLSLTVSYPQLSVSKRQDEFIKSFVKSHGLEEKTVIGIHPGASLSVKQYKRYPDVMSGVIDKIKEKEKYAVLVFCGRGEEDAANDVYHEVVKKGVKAIVVSEKLENYIGLVSECDYMICNDSGAGHIAAAYGIPVTVIFGPVLPDMYKPLGQNKVFVVSHQLECKPCIKRNCPLGTNVCIDGISPNEVIDTVSTMINEARRIAK